MKRKALLFLSFFLAMAFQASAQTIGERSNTVTLFDTYRPGMVYLTSGKKNFIREMNIFMKKSTLVYKSSGKVMEANMKVVNNLVIDGHNFINCQNQLAEVIDTVNQNKLVSVKTIDEETMKREYMNNSTFASIDIGDMLSYTRNDANVENGYPVLETYYFIIDGKQILCHERNVKVAIGKKKQDIYHSITSQFFSWSNRDDLMRLLKALTTGEITQ